MMRIDIPEPTLKAEALDVGFYKDHCGDRGVPATTALAQQSPPPQELVDAAKARFLSQNPNYKETASMAAADSPLEQWAEGRAALSHILKWYEAKTSNRIVTVADFYGPDSSIQALFPAYVESEFQAGLIASGLVPWLVFATEQVNSETVRDIYDANAEYTRSLKVTRPGDELPRHKFTFADSDVYLTKFGAAIEATYEVVRNQRVDALGHQFRRIAAQVAVDETDLALSTLISGDGTTAGSAETNSTDVDVETSGTILYSDMLSWVYNTTTPYEIDKAVGGKTDLALIANLAEFKAVSKPGGYVADLVSPLNVSYRRWDGGVNGSSYVDRLVIGIDSRVALKKYMMGGMLQETDKIISRQTNLYTFSYYAGFRKFDSAGCHVLDCAGAL